MNARAIITDESIVRRKAGVLEAEVDDEVVLLSIDKGNCYGLNKVGSRIWQFIAEPCRVADIGTRLMAEYDIDADTCRQQVLALLEHLLSEDLITLSGGTGP